MIKSKNLGKFYKYVSKKRNHTSEIPPLRNNKGLFLFKDTEKANTLNDYFVSICTKDNGIFPAFTPPSPKILFRDIKRFNVSQVSNQLKRLKNGYSVGPDGIPSILFKKLASCLAYPLHLIFNIILISGCLLNIWKLADVIPIFKKKGTVSDPSNYRPISLTCVACKVFESLIKNHLLEYLSVNEMHSEDQHGFIQKNQRVRIC